MAAAADVPDGSHQESGPAETTVPAVGNDQPAEVDAKVCEAEGGGPAVVAVDAELGGCRVERRRPDERAALRQPIVPDASRLSFVSCPYTGRYVQENGVLTTAVGYPSPNESP